MIALLGHSALFLPAKSFERSGKQYRKLGARQKSDEL